MKLLTKVLRNKLPPLYSTEEIPSEMKKAVVKFFYPSGRATWYAVEFDQEDTFFGYVVSPLGPDCDEWGYFSLKELENLQGKYGLKVERDKWWDPNTPMSEVIQKEVS